MSPGTDSFQLTADMQSDEFIELLSILTKTVRYKTMTNSSNNNRMLKFLAGAAILFFPAWVFVVEGKIRQYTQIKTSCWSQKREQ